MPPRSVRQIPVGGAPPCRLYNILGLYDRDSFLDEAGPRLFPGDVEAVLEISSQMRTVHPKQTNNRIPCRALRWQHRHCLYGRSVTVGILTP